ncbi:DUF397 domain-containing protein [Streptomyces niger]|uniref:DUF397 domain-containing protein n=1 Tax=Streptomyces niger TaxID=66373 RepID=UPI00069C1FA4|nr:DUF397 domain-containing protein [Streptomyces niger]
MSDDEVDARTWFKSSHSGTEGDNCVEVALGAAVVRVRDSKDTARPTVTVRRGPWAEFVRFVAR